MAIIKIYNPIMQAEDAVFAEFFGAGGVTYANIDDFIASIPEDDDTIDIRLHCVGGDCSEGWAIYDALRRTGKKITATVEGTCASMATVVLLAASERKAVEHAQFLIHDARFMWLCLEEATADKMGDYAEMLATETQRILDLYVERTGAERAELEEMMKAEKWFDADRAKELGFISEILPPISAKAKPKFSNNMSKDKKKSNEGKRPSVAEALSALAQAIGLKATVEEPQAAADEPKPKAYVLETESGEMLTIEKPDGEAPEKGDRAYPDGEHKMKDGSTIIVEDETIVEIVPAEEGNEELEQAKARIAELEQANATLTEELETAKANAKTEEDVKILDAVKLAGGIKALAAIQSKHTPTPRREDTKKTPEGRSELAEQLAKRREALKAEREARAKK